MCGILLPYLNTFELKLINYRYTDIQMLRRATFYTEHMLQNYITYM